MPSFDVTFVFNGQFTVRVEVEDEDEAWDAAWQEIPKDVPGLVKALGGMIDDIFIDPASPEPGEPEITSFPGKTAR